MASPLSDLDELVLKCRDQKAKDYIKESVSCYKRRLLLCIVFFIVLILSSCATTPSQQAMQIKDADMATVKHCKFVCDVHGSSGWGNIAASTGIQNAKNEAREKAASMGATHIVWGNISGGYSPYVSGKAYRCK